MRSLRLAVIISAVALNLTGCIGTYTREAYVPTHRSIEYEGIEYERTVPDKGLSVSNSGPEGTYVDLVPQLRRESRLKKFYESPYSLTVSVRTHNMQFDRVTLERVVIYVPETQRRIELISEPQTYKLLLEREAFLYAHQSGLGGPIDLDFEAETLLHLVLEYSFRGPSTEVCEYRREEFRFWASLSNGEFTIRLFGWPSV